MQVAEDHKSFTYNFNQVEVAMMLKSSPLTASTGTSGDFNVECVCVTDSDLRTKDREFHQSSHHLLP